MRKVLWVGGLWALVLLGSCVSSAPVHNGVPPEISAWIDTHNDANDVYYGQGISSYGTGKDPYTNSSDALLQASTLARADLASNLESVVANTTIDLRAIAERNGETARIEALNAGTKQLSNQIIFNSKTFSRKNGIGETYVIVYTDKENTNKSIDDYVKEVFADMSEELNKGMEGLEQ